MEKRDRLCEFVFLRTSMNPRHRGIAAGGARRDRTDDLLLAKQALSQLSYGPLFSGKLKSKRHHANIASLSRAKAGGPGKI
jgi:hypothetical protein